MYTAILFIHAVLAPYVFAVWHGIYTGLKDAELRSPRAHYLVISRSISH